MPGVKTPQVIKSHQKQEFYQQNVDRINDDIATEEKALAEIVESMNENARLLEQNKKEIGARAKAITGLNNFFG